MKIFFTFLSLIFISFQGFTQKKLSTSTQSGYYTYIYKLTNNEAAELAKQPKLIEEERYLHNLVDSFYSAKNYKKELSFGNYIYQNVSRNNVNYYLKQVSNIDLEFVNNLKDFQFYLVDKKGNYIKDAKVWIGNNKNIQFDSKAQLYRSTYPKKEDVIRVDYQNVSNFFTFDLDNNRYNTKADWPFFKKLAYSSPIKYTWQPIKKLFKKRYRNKSKQPHYIGYMVFSKPKYKPLDTVKFKAYLLNAKGKTIANKTVEVNLYNGQADKKMASIKPYKDGGYEYSFVLADSLNLKLDRSYTITLTEKIGKEDSYMIGQSFNYEDYELKSLNFAVRTDKETHKIGEPVTVFLKATDENELAVPDGRVEITVLTNSISKYYNNKVFVPDTLWKKSLNLEPIGETKLTLPDSIFPKADLSFTLNFNFRNSNNEARNATKSLYYKIDNNDRPEKEIKSSLKKDSLALEYFFDNKPEKQYASVISYSKEDVKLDSQKVELPTAIKIDYRAEYYTVSTDSGISDDIYLSDFEPNISIGALQGKDTLSIVVNNEHKVPFWYTVFSGDKVFFKGYTNALDTAIRHTNSKAAHIKINYYWDNEEKTIEESTFYTPNTLNVKLLAPDMVYPGQKVNMLVKVTDINNKPVSETDLTAYAATSKFTNSYIPSIPNFNKGFYARKTKKLNFESEEVSVNGNVKLNWQRWGKKLGLDTIEYYKFTHPKPIYSVYEIANDTTTQVAPFAILKGEILPVNIVYIDEVPVFFNQAEQLSRYSFKVKPGRHNIRLRTYNKDIFIYGYEIPKGKKTIAGIASDTTNSSVKVVAVANVLNASESDFLNRYMFKVKDNFNAEKTIIKADTTDILLNPPPNPYTNKELLVGPIKENYLQFKNKNLTQDFTKEPGYTYTFTAGLIKQKSYDGKFAFNPNMLTGNSRNTDFTQYVLKKNEIDSIWNDYLNLRSYTTQLFTISLPKYTQTGRLVYTIDTAFTNKLPYIKNVIIYKKDEPDFMQIYAGNRVNLSFFNVGEYRIMFLLKDNRYFNSEQVIVKSDGLNYYKWDSFNIAQADNFSKKIDDYIKSIKKNDYYAATSSVNLEVIEQFNDKNYDLKSLTDVMTGLVWDENDKQPIPSASIKIVGLNISVFTDKNGKFTLNVPANGKIIIASIGYETVTIKTKNGDIGTISLKADNHALEEVVVVGYGAKAEKKSLSYSTTVVTAEQMLSGKVSGLSIENSRNFLIRGTSSFSAAQKPIIIVDGVPFNGDIESINKDDIVAITILKDTEGTAIYGSSAANGLIIIKTKKGNTAVNAAGELVAQQQTMRTNFNDEGFWQPKLITDETGTAKFTVKFPDDITNWKARVVAMNGNKQSGFTEASIKSFKSLSANFVSPLFAVKGDSINVIGKLMNYTPFEENVTRKLIYNGIELKNSNIKFKNAHIDTAMVVANGKDSLNFEYTLKQENGYFDGEIRKIPVFEAGVTETKGYFSALLRDTAITYNFDKNIGKITLRAEASIFPTLLDEMTKLRNYEYLCNEQLASKLKSLLLEKRVRKYLGQIFNHEKDIAFILKKLQQTKKPQGTWGWWQNSDEQIWISLHVVEALLQAEKQGYAVDLNKAVLYRYLVNKLSNEPDYNEMQTIKLLNLLDDKNYIKDWVLAFEKKKTVQKPSLYERLELMELKQMAGIKVNVDTLMAIKKQTMFGSIYWGEENIRFWDNSIQNTLMAYKILKNAGGYTDELEKIALYFLEQRKDGQWRNTFEASLILETILPEMLNDDKKVEAVSLTLNEETVTKFPYDKILENVQAVKLIKKGKMPVYFTAYQQFQNIKPEKVSKNFTVNTSFIQNRNAVKKLKAGTLATLRVEVDIRADAEYVMVEIPIPAGCSYENKKQSFWGVETHREYFKNKTSIFCTKLKQGKYTFDIDLMPRYSGSYVLNPAKAEMMYFPVFYGREGIKRIGVN